MEYITPPYPYHLALKYQYMANLASFISCPLLPAPWPHWIVLKKKKKKIPNMLEYMYLSLKHKRSFKNYL